MQPKGSSQFISVGSFKVWGMVLLPLCSVHSVASDSATPWTVPCQPSLSTGFLQANHALLRGIFPTQGSNLGLILHCRWILHCLSHLMKLLFFPWLKLSLLFFTVCVCVCVSVCVCVCVCVPDIRAPEIRAWGSAGQPGASPVIAQARKTPPGSRAPGSWTPAGAVRGGCPSTGCLLAGTMVPESPRKPAHGPSKPMALQLPSRTLAPRGICLFLHRRCNICGGGAPNEVPQTHLKMTLVSL